MAASNVESAGTVSLSNEIHLHTHQHFATAHSLDGGHLAPVFESVKTYLENYDSQTALSILQRIELENAGQLSDSAWFRLLTLRGHALRLSGKFDEAGRCFLQSKDRNPSGEDAAFFEAFGYDLLRDDTRAAELATQARARYPESARIASLYLQTALLSRTFEELEAEIQPHLRTEPDVAIGLALAAVNRRRPERGSEYANLALKKSPDWIDAKVLWASSRIESSAKNENDLTAQDKEGIREACSTLQDCIARSRSNATATRIAGLLLNLSVGLSLLKDDEAALEAMKNARRLDPQNQEISRQYAIMLWVHGKANEALQILRPIAYESEPHVRLVYARMLGQRGQPGDVDEAINVLKCDWENGTTFDVGFQAEWLETLLKLLLAKRNASEARALLDSKGGLLNELQRLTFIGRTSALAGETVEIEPILKLLRENPSARETPHVIDAALFVESLGSQTNALTLWKYAITPASDIGLLRHVMRVALSEMDEDYILALGEQLRSSGIRDRTLVEIELAVIEKVSPSKTLAMLQELIDDEPPSELTRYLRMRRSVLAMRANRPDLIEREVQNLPKPDEIEEYFCEPAILALREADSTAAIATAYQLVRKFDSASAHAAMVHTLMPPPEIEPQIPMAPVVGPDTAVRLLDMDSNEKIAYVLETDASPRSSLDEISGQGAIAKSLLGKRLGDEVLLADNFGTINRLRIEEILHKWVFRFQECLREFRQKFPEHAFFKQIRVRENLPPEEGLREFLAELTEMHSKREQALEFYTTNPLMPIQMLSRALGSSIVEAMEIATWSERLGIRSCFGSADEVRRADEVAANAASLVLDITALVTLYLLSTYAGIAPDEIFANWNSAGYISEFSLVALKQFRKKLQEGGERMGPIAIGGRVLPQITSEEEVKRVAELRLPNLEAVIAFASKRLTVVPGSTLSSIPSKLRDDLVRAIGRPSAESLHIAAVNTAVLWSDDRVVNEIARTENGTGYAWTQAICRRLLRDRPDTLRTVTLQLLDLRYVGTLIDINDLAFAGQTASWDPDRYPLRAIIDQLVNAAISPEWTLRVMGISIRNSWSDPVLGLQAQKLTQRVLDRVGKRPDGTLLIHALERSLPELFGLHVVAAENVKQMVRNWRIANPERRIVAP